MKRSSDEEQFLYDLFQWCIFSGVMGSDEVTTRYFQGSRRVTTQKDVRTALKSLGTLCGLEPCKLSTSSLRKGFATTAISSGVSRDQTCSRGGWKKSSSCIDQHYAVNVNASGGLSLGAQGFNISDMRRL